LDDGYVDEPSDGSVDADGSFDDAPRTSSDIDLDAEGEIDQDEPEPEVERDDGRPYSLRQRTTKINYAIPPALEEMKPVKSRPNGARGGGNKRRGPGGVPLVLNSAGGWAFPQLMIRFVCTPFLPYGS